MSLFYHVGFIIQTVQTVLTNSTISSHLKTQLSSRLQTDLMYNFYNGYTTIKAGWRKVTCKHCLKETSSKGTKTTRKYTTFTGKFFSVT